MPWVILLVSALLEAVWATALGASDGFTRLIPSAVFAVALVASMAGLGYAARRIQMSTAYAVWTGTGAALTVAWGMFTGTETVTVRRVLFLTGIIASVLGLKLVKARALGASAGEFLAGLTASDPAPPDGDRRQRAI